MLLLLRFWWVLRCLLWPFGLKFASGGPHRVTEITVAPGPALELGPILALAYNHQQYFSISSLESCDYSKLTASDSKELARAEHQRNYAAAAMAMVTAISPSSLQLKCARFLWSMPRLGSQIIK